MPDADNFTHSVAVRYQQVRQLTEMLCEPLELEDYGLQSSPNTPPIKWHLGHVSWLIEVSVLERFVPAYKVYRAQFDPLFGFIDPLVERSWARPTLIEVLDYRRYVDEQVLLLLQQDYPAELAQELELCLQYEQMQQETLLVKIKAMLSDNSLIPSYQAKPPKRFDQPAKLSYSRYAQQIAPVGCAPSDHCFNNELPRHEVLLPAYELSNRPVCNEEVLDFIADGGYQRAELWLQAGWSWLRQRGVDCPQYWRRQDGWKEFTLNGLQPLNLAAPACHLNYFEADAIARWLGARLPTEFEWEWAAAEQTVAGNLFEKGLLHPESIPQIKGMGALFGNVWQWTTSSFNRYPGAPDCQRIVDRALNKHMHGHYVLRGGSCITSAGLVRHSYRFYQPAESRIYFSGLRLARSLG